MVTIGLHILVGGSEGQEALAHWGDFSFVALPREGDRFSVWRDRRLTVLEIVRVSQSPIPRAPTPEHEPMWPPEYDLPAAYVTACILPACED